MLKISTVTCPMCCKIWSIRHLKLISAGVVECPWCKHHFSAEQQAKTWIPDKSVEFNELKGTNCKCPECGSMAMVGLTYHCGKEGCKFYSSWMNKKRGSNE